MMIDCKTCLLEHAEAGDDLTSELAVELSAAKAKIKQLQTIVDKAIADEEAEDALYSAIEAAEAEEKWRNDEP